MSDLTKVFFSDMQEVLAPTTTELKDLQQLVEKQLDLERAIKDADQFIKETKEKLVSVQNVAIPALLDEIGIKDFRLTNGMRVTLKEDVKASMRADKVGEAVAWLDDHGIGDIVKDEVKVNFGRGEAKNAAVLLDYCASHGYQASEKQSVHPMTLKATVKEQMANGVEFPEELFSIFPDRKSVIKLK